MLGRIGDLESRLARLNKRDLQGPSLINQFGSRLVYSYQVGFPAELTSHYDPEKGYSWKMLLVGTDQYPVSVESDPQAPSGDYALTPDNNTRLTPGTRGWIEPDPGQQGWIFLPVGTPSGEGYYNYWSGSGTPSGSGPPTTPCGECLSKLCVTRNPYTGAITGIFYQTDSGLVPVPECGSGGGSGPDSGSGGGGGSGGGSGNGCGTCQWQWNGTIWALVTICAPGCNCPPPPNRSGSFVGEIVTLQCYPNT